jgi:hypothetical protein
VARDGKYGQVQLENGTVPEDEEVVVFRGQDKLLPTLLRIYRLLCEDAGSPAFHLNLIAQRAREVEEWQKNNGARVPASAGYQERIGA